MNNFQEFKESLVADDQIHVNRKTDACNWKTPSGLQVFHERTYWGRVMNVSRSKKTLAEIFHGVFNEVLSSYWSETVYADKKEAKSDAKKYGGAVEMCFYCDEKNPTWFLIFHDFDKAAQHAFDKLSVKL